MSLTISERTLDGGLVLRAASTDDGPAIVDLSVAAHGPRDAGAVRFLLDRPERWTVVTDGDHIVSCCVLLEHRASYAGVALDLGQIEYVATDAAYRRRGLVRAQFDEHHRVSAAIGQHLTVVTGIPYFYRRLGYSYGLQYPQRHRLTDHRPAHPAPWTVEAAGPADLGDLARLHEQAHRAADLVTFRTTREWQWLLDHGAAHGEELLVARRDRRVEGFARLQRRPDELVGRVELFEAAADSVGAGRALLAHARAGDGGADLAVLDRPGTPFSAALRAAGEPTDDYHPAYVRIPDPVAFLRHIRSVLSERLAASVYSGETGTLALSLYDATILLSYDAGEVTEVAWGPAMEDPFEDGHAGVSPDALPALLLGRFGARALEARDDDVTLGPDGPLLEVLFPRMRADLPLTI